MYIVSSYCISPQASFNESCFESGDVRIYDTNKLTVLEPKYSEQIPYNLLRRMGRAVRLGVGGAMESMIRHPFEAEGIIVGSAVGGLEDCIKFLDQIYLYEEGNLTPTNFVQSTPNAIAGGLALLTKNTGYNMTHVNGAAAFLNALSDAKMLFHDSELNRLLVISVEEISSYNYNINQLAGIYKNEFIRSSDLLQTSTKGTICGEGSCVFQLQKTAREYEAEIVASCTLSHLSNGEKIKQKLAAFLSENVCSPADISSVILGFNGDSEQDGIYYDLAEGLFNTANIYSFKNLVGEYPTAASFAIWQAIHLFKGRVLPQSLLFDRHQKPGSHILIYNHYLLEEHNFILLRK